MDLTLDIEDYKLNIRAAAVIIHDNKLLVHKDVNEDHCTLPGGRIAIGESSRETVKREINEEMGKEIEITGYIGTVENFFEDKQKKYHEILFIQNAEFINDEDKKINYTLHNIEGKDYLNYEWIDLDKIEEYNIVPKCLQSVLKSQSFPMHLVNNELK